MLTDTYNFMYTILYLGVIEDRLHNIESQMADQLNVIKTMILNIEDKLAQQDVQYRRANRKLHGAVAELTESVQSCATLQQSGWFFYLVQYQTNIDWISWAFCLFSLLVAEWSTEPLYLMNREILALRKTEFVLFLLLTRSKSFLFHGKDMWMGTDKVRLGFSTGMIHWRVVIIHKLSLL